MPLKINNKKVNFIVSNNKPVKKIFINDEVKYEFNTTHWDSDYLEYVECYELPINTTGTGYSIFTKGGNTVAGSRIQVVVLSPYVTRVGIDRQTTYLYCKWLIIDREKGRIWYLANHSSTTLSTHTFSNGVWIEHVTNANKKYYGNTKVYTFRKRTLANFKNLSISLIENSTSLASKAMAYGESNSANLNQKTPNVGDDSDTILHIGYSNPSATTEASIASAAGSNTLVATNGLAVGHLTLDSKTIPDDPTTEDYVYNYTYSMTYYEPRNFTDEYRHTVDYNYTLYKHPDGTSSGSFITNGFIKADTTITLGSTTRSAALVRITFA